MSREGEVRRHVHVWLTIGEWAGYRCVACQKTRTEPIERAWAA